MTSADVLVIFGNQVAVSFSWSYSICSSEEFLRSRVFLALEGRNIDMKIQSRWLFFN